MKTMKTTTMAGALGTILSIQTPASERPLVESIQLRFAHKATASVDLVKAMFYSFCLHSYDLLWLLSSLGFFLFKEKVNAYGGH